MKARTAIAVAALAALTACGGGGGGSGGAVPFAAAPASPASEPKTQAEQPPGKVPACSVAYWGDSISALTAPRLGKGLQVALHSVVGGTAAANAPAFLQDPLVARFVVLEFGTNDANAHAPFEPAMRSMLERIKAVGRTPVVVGLSNATVGEALYHATYNALAGNLAREYGALFVDWAAVTWSPADLMADGVHPADAYQKRLADELTRTIVAAAPECAS